jgi:archaeosine-15-forming tRNA-guanine transglycosylase
MILKKTKKNKTYISTGIKELDKVNKEIANKGKSIFDQYDIPDCKHGVPIDECIICDEEDD